jgi:hypothetical protein
MRIRSIEKSNDFIGNRTRDLPALRAPGKKEKYLLLCPESNPDISAEQNVSHRYTDYPGSFIIGRFLKKHMCKIYEGKYGCIRKGYSRVNDLD